MKRKIQIVDKNFQFKMAGHVAGMMLLASLIIVMVIGFYNYQENIAMENVVKG